MQKKIKLLFLASDPRNVRYRPDLYEEFREIKKSIRASKYRDYFKLEYELAVQPLGLQEALSQHEPDIVHYSGHGNKQGLVLQNSVGRRTLVSKRMLSELFKTTRGIRIVFLNSCYSEAQLEAIAEKVDFTIGMNDTVRDKNAITLATTFYRELGSGRSVKDAFRAAKAGLTLKKAPSSKAPELRIREGANASSPFVTKRPSRPRAKTRKPELPGPPGGQIIVGRDIKGGSTAIVGHNARVDQRRFKR